jgi:hypothetical protein
MDSKLQHRHNGNDDWHTVRTDDARTDDPALELARWLEVPDAIDEPGEWRCVIRLADGTEVVGEEITVDTGELQ